MLVIFFANFLPLVVQPFSVECMLNVFILVCYYGWLCCLWMASYVCMMTASSVMKV